jgi:hypothetical protein
VADGPLAVTGAAFDKGGSYLGLFHEGRLG